jgi:hypothetical protein
VTTPRMRLVTDVTAAEFEQLARQDHVRDRLERLLAIEAAAEALVDKADEHERKGFHHIKLGAIAPLRDAVNGTETQR